MKRKNLLIIGSSQGIYGGIEAFMIALTDAAFYWPEFNVRVCFKLIKGAEASDDLKKITGKLPVSSYYVERGSANLIKLIRWADILHVQNTPPDIIFPARLLFKKIFLTIHNRRHGGKNLHTFLWDIAIKFANQRWFNSNFVWDSWEPGNKLPNSSFVPTVCKLPAAWLQPGDRKGFLFVGRWIKNKGIEEILKAYALNEFDELEWPLTLLGDGPIRSEVADLIQKLNIKDISVPGFVDDQLKEKYLSSAKWLLAPAKTKEDLGLTPIEARSVGVPSIVTRDGGLPESGGEAALIAEPGNVEDLAKCMKIAATMSREEYENRSFISRNSLKDFLKPIDFYRSSYSIK